MAAACCLRATAEDCGAGCGSKAVFNDYVYDARDSLDTVRPAPVKDPRPR